MKRPVKPINKGNMKTQIEKDLNESTSPSDIMSNALQSIMENLNNRAMSNEQEKAFARSPECESWRVYLNSLILQARNEAKFALAQSGR